MLRRLLLFSLLATGYSEMVLGPGDRLTGTWSRPDARLQASSWTVVFTRSCAVAWFGGLTIAADSTFEAVSDSSVAMTITGPVRGAPLRIQGRFIGNDLRLEYYELSSGGPPHEPAVFETTLAPGSRESLPDCIT